MSISRNDKFGAGVHDVDLNAAPDEPWLSVHAIAEYTFCPRAGLLAYENPLGDMDDEPPAFDTLPAFELNAIEAETSRQRNSLFRWLWGSAIATAISLFAISIQQYWLLVIGFVAMAFFSYQSGSTLLTLLDLLNRLGLAQSGYCAEPQPNVAMNQPVNWFGMLRLGFESQRLQEPLPDADWQFDGKPWRVLRRGSLTIPVFRTRSVQVKLHDQHIAKIMAYCHLCSVCFGTECPYGIVLTGDDYSGFAVSTHSSNLEKFHKSLVELRQFAQSAKQRNEDSVRIDKHKCNKCPFGQPHPVALGRRVYREGVPIPIKVTGSWNQRATHSDCGDRFDWVPPYGVRGDSQSPNI